MLSFENENCKTSHSGYYLPKVVKKDYNVKIDRKTFLIIQWIIILKHENITKIATDQGDDCTAGCLLDYPYFKENY